MKINTLTSYQKSNPNIMTNTSIGSNSEVRQPLSISQNKLYHKGKSMDSSGKGIEDFQQYITGHICAIPKYLARSSVTKLCVAPVSTIIRTSLPFNLASTNNDSRGLLLGGWSRRATKVMKLKTTIWLNKPTTLSFPCSAQSTSPPHSMALLAFCFVTYYCFLWAGTIILSFLKVGKKQAT